MKLFQLNSIKEVQYTPNQPHISILSKLKPFPVENEDQEFPSCPHLVPTPIHEKYLFSARASER